MGRGGVQGGNKVGGTSREDVSGVGGSVGVEGGDVAVLAEVATLLKSPGKGVSSISCPKSPKTKSPRKIGDSGADHVAHDGQVSPTASLNMSSIADPPNVTKLLILNVHGTLLDTTLLTQQNPNPNIRVSKKTTTRRLVYRPWMMEFLGMCFKFFKVAFWGRKSIQYMEEILREILPVYSHLEGHKPMFTWAAKDCEVIQESEEGSIWGKPLSKVWDKWPCWNATNTIMIDHHVPRVDCNPQWNVIVPPPFYVARLKDISEDKDYLKENLWPALQHLYAAKDVGSFWSTANVSKMQPGMGQLKSFSRNMAVPGPCTPMAESTGKSLGGEGSCELEVHNGNFSPLLPCARVLIPIGL